MRYKITIVGAGMTGASTAAWLAERELADIVLVDIPQTKNMPKGKGLDLTQAGPIIGYDSRITGTANGSYEGVEGSDIVIITAGIPRQPGMTREDLVSANQAAMTDVIQKIVQSCPDAILIILTNPLDTMAYLAHKLSGFPKSRVIGQAGVLDSARFRTFLAMELDVSVENVQAFVLGGHGDEMVPLTRYTSVAGIPVAELLPKDRLDAIVERTRKGGGEIVQLLEKGSAYYAPGAACAQMAEAILKDKKLIVPCSVFLDGEYGLRDMFFGVPVKLGKNGVEQIIEVKLTDDERAALNKSAELVRGTMSALKF